MKNYFSSLVIIFSLLGAMIPSSAAVPSTESVMKDAAEAGRYLALLFHASGAKDAQMTGLLGPLQEHNADAKEKVVLHRVDVSSPVDKEIVERYGIARASLPLLLLVAPNGVVTGGFDRKVTKEQVASSVSVNPLVLKFLKPLREGKVALVALQNETSTHRTASWKAVSDFVSAPHYAPFVEAIRADPASPESAEFMIQCGLEEGLKEAVVVVPPGRIGGVLRGKISESDILGVIQSCGPGGCGTRH